MVIGQDLENRAAHPDQEFPEVPPTPPSCSFWHNMEKVNETKYRRFWQQ